MASQHFQIQPPKVKLPVPHSFLHVLSAFERLLYPRHWTSNCGNLASAAGTQVHINSVFGEISIVPRLCEGHQPGRGGFSLLPGESKLWVFQEMSDLPGFRAADQLELREGG